MLAMAQQPPPSNVGQVSGDGRWRWDGHQWVPNTPVLAGGYMVPAQPGALVVAPKNPAVSLIVSFFLPGVGSMINGDTNRGILILALYLVSALAIIVLIGIPFAIGIWIWGMSMPTRARRPGTARTGSSARPPSPG